jgi:hypothetical protein
LSSDPNCTNRFYPPTDIKSVSYTSNGKILNATIWLNSPPGKSTRDYHSPKNMTANELTAIKSVSYSMYIDVKSVYAWLLK